MENIKISVVIPMYNRRHYIEESINSILNQSFQDFEIVIVDDGSTDNSYDFCKKKYGHFKNIRLLSNDRNVGEGKTTNRLFKEARGKYIAILHSDDLFLPDALKNLYEVAEATNADVVHTIGHIRSAEGDGSIIKPDGKFYLHLHDRYAVKKTIVMSNNPKDRIAEWLTGGTFIDPPYNLFNRNFVLSNNIFWETFGGHTLFTFRWIISAKVFVKVPFATYIYRLAPDSMSNKQKAPQDIKDTIENHIDRTLKTIQYYDYFMDKIEFLNDKELLKDCIKMHIFFINDNWTILRPKFYSQGITKDIYQAVKTVMKNHFGCNAWLPMFLYHIMHEQQFNRNIEHEKMFIENYLNLEFTGNVNGAQGGGYWQLVSLCHFFMNLINYLKKCKVNL